MGHVGCVAIDHELISRTRTRPAIPRSVTRSASRGNPRRPTSPAENRANVDGYGTSSTLLGWGEGCGEPGEGDGLAAEGAGAEDEGEHDLQFVQGLVEGHPGAATFGSVRIMVMKAWARTARVTCRCQPVNDRPSKWSRPRPVLSSR